MVKKMIVKSFIPIWKATTFRNSKGQESVRQSLNMDFSSKFKTIFRSLQYRNYRLFFTGQSISLIGTWMQRIAMPWLVYHLTGSAFLLGLVSFAGQIPAFLLAPIAGVITDKHS